MELIVLGNIGMSFLVVKVVANYKSNISKQTLEG